VTIDQVFAVDPAEPVGRKRVPWYRRVVTVLNLAEQIDDLARANVPPAELAPQLTALFFEVLRLVHDSGIGHAELQRPLKPETKPDPFAAEIPYWRAWLENGGRAALETWTPPPVPKIDLTHELWLALSSGMVAGAGATPEEAQLDAMESIRSSWLESDGEELAHVGFLDPRFADNHGGDPIQSLNTSATTGLTFVKVCGPSREVLLGAFEP